jgi:Fe-S-cluster containining protein
MYAPKDKKDWMVPVRLDLDSTFAFPCDKEMACFTRCCRDAYIMLTPYDIIRMKQRLGVPADVFLSAYTTVDHIEKTELPIPVLKMREDESKACPFLSESGCVIYEDRPVTCRYYPISAGMFHNRDAAADERFFALVKEDHCLGHELGAEHTVRAWMEEQGITPYDEINAGWAELILKRKSLGPFVNIADKTLKMFFTGCYNVDSFRRFVFDSRFLDVYVVPEETQKAIAGDDLALLRFAIDWVTGTLYGGGNLKIREQVAEGEELEAESD